ARHGRGIVPPGRKAWPPPSARSLRLVELVGLLFERLVGRDVRGQDAVEVLDLLVLDVVLEVLLEVELLADERALRVRAEVGRLGGRREAHLPIVARVLERLADDDADVLVAERRHPGRVLVPLREELEEARRDARLDDPAASTVAHGGEA